MLIEGLNNKMRIDNVLRIPESIRNVNHWCFKSFVSTYFTTKAHLLFYNMYMTFILLFKSYKVYLSHEKNLII